MFQSLKTVNKKSSKCIPAKSIVNKTTLACCMTHSISVQMVYEIGARHFTEMK